MRAEEYQPNDARYWGVTMNRARALYVRELRVLQGLTWREVATQCADQWDGCWGNNQDAGVAFCTSAAMLLGEDPDAEPWN